MFQAETRHGISKFHKNGKIKIQVLYTVFCQSDTSPCSFVANFPPIVAPGTSWRETFKSSALGNGKQASVSLNLITAQSKQKNSSYISSVFPKNFHRSCSGNLCPSQLEVCPGVISKCLPNCRVYLICAVYIPEVSC